jgi:hypothetical protein
VKEGVILSEQGLLEGQVGDAVFGWRLLQQAIQKYQDALATKPDDYRGIVSPTSSDCSCGSCAALYNWGLSLLHCAIQRCSLRDVEISTNDNDGFNDSNHDGNDTDESNRDKSNSDSIICELFHSAYCKFEEVLEIHPGDCYAAEMAANTLLEQASRKLLPKQPLSSSTSQRNTKEKQLLQLLQTACQMYRLAYQYSTTQPPMANNNSTHHNQHYHSQKSSSGYCRLLFHWGSALLLQVSYIAAADDPDTAETVESKKTQLLIAACEKFASSLLELAGPATPSMSNATSSLSLLSPHYSLSLIYKIRMNYAIALAKVVLLLFSNAHHIHWFCS